MRVSGLTKARAEDLLARAWDLDGLRSRVENSDLIRYAFDAAEKGRRSSADREAWLRFIEATAGSIPDPTFERPPQGAHEQRHALR